MAVVRDYFRLTKEYKNKYVGKKTVVIMQVGKFFEFYGLKNPNTGEITGSDVVNVAHICGMIVASKNINIDKHQVVMAGFPVYNLDKYLKKIQDDGYIAALYVQDSPTKNTTRSLQGIYSPGTFFPLETEKISNNIVCVFIEKRKSVLSPTGRKPDILVGLSNIDIYTGKATIFEFNNTYIHSPSTFDEIERFVSIHNPSEIIILYKNFSKSQINDIINFSGINCDLIHKIDVEGEGELNKSAINCEKQVYQREILHQFYEANETFILDLSQYELASQAFCFMLNYIYTHNPNLIRKISEPVFENCTNRLILANHSLKQLNIIDDQNYNGKLSSVMKFINRCFTPMGRRLLNNYLLNPTSNEEFLQREYDIVEYYLGKYKKFDYIHNNLFNIKDIEKLNRKIYLKKITPQSLYYFYENLQTIKNIYAKTSKDTKLSSYLKHFINGNIKKICTEFISLFNKYIVVDICKEIDTLQLETNFIQKKIHDALDNASQKWMESKDKLECVAGYLNSIVAKCEKASKNPSQYVKCHQTDKLGYSLVATSRRCKILEGELKKMARKKKCIGLDYVSSYDNTTKTINLDISNIISYAATGSYKTIINDEIKIFCKDINEYKEKMKIELDFIYGVFLEKLQNYQEQFDNIIKYVSYLDVLQCKCFVAAKYKYCKPVLVDGPKSFVDIKNLRHCLIEQLQTNEIYVANDICLGKGDLDGILLYGTNAVGKTSLIKSLGIAVIMAQAGMYVPCDDFQYKPYKSIFTRILGNDNIFKGLSTFTMEMYELRNILNLSDESSLILGDELCSGTETESAISILVTGLMNLHKKQCSFIFATHFHEIVNMDEITSLERIAMKHMTVIYNREKDVLEYNRKLRDGSGESMYGLEVCKSLSLPQEFLETAHRIRMKYCEREKAILSLKLSHYNQQKLKGLCEFCGINMGDDIHHLQYQKDADENGFIGHFHKNHKANLVAVCKSCHDNIHKSEQRYRKIKTSEGYSLVAMSD